ncbi:6-pyruvoyl tetrahydropterin synthase [[Synechococcus] sp. NIES-970]|nr:6-pyruvoyl tetrahydropterin synthase [[Synechococcus] sp. NIES-970]
MAQWELYKEFRFEAAHQLPHHDGKCARLHGHSWVMRVYLRGDRLHTTGPKQGMLFDFGDIKKYVQPLLDQYLDHYHLNDSLGMESPTSEAIAQWIYGELKKVNLPGLAAVEIKETCTAGCIYTED